MKENIIRHNYTISRKERKKLLNQNAFLLWFTGLSGSGKSTIANGLERKLYEEGFKTYTLDGDNVRKGLNSDLDFSPEGRKENIRRIAEVAGLIVDSGIIVLQLGNEPGVFSARYAGANATDEENNIKLLEKLKSFPEPHKAKFVCAAVFYFGTDFKVSMGEINGQIIKKPRGTNGFGYDPLFLPDGYNKTSAELPPEIKNKISHRFIAFNQLKKYLMES